MTARTYRAFISYSHRDAQWGKWLQSQLEAYRVPKDMVGLETAAGPVPDNLRPIFRDRLDLSAGPSLQAKLDAALQASQNLIVICSPTSAKSVYVNEEVRRFKAMGKADRVLALIVDGEPGHAERECFPEALRFAVDRSGKITSKTIEPVAADVRPEADGKTLAKLKLISGLLGVELDALRRREEIAERKRKRVLYAVAASMTGLAIIASATAVWNYTLLERNRSLSREQVKLLDGTLNRATELVDQAVIFSRREGIPATMPKAILEQVELMFEALVATDLGKESVTLKAREAIMLLRIAENRGVLGDTRLREKYVRRVVEILDPLVRDENASADWRNDLAWGYTELGVVHRTRGDLQKAHAAIKKGFAIRKALVEAEPDHRGWQGSLSNSHAQIGDILHAQGDTAGALESYSTALDIKTRLARETPGNTVLRGELSRVHLKIGLVHRSRGDPDAAQQAFRTSLDIIEKLTETEPFNVYWKRDLSVVQDHIGDLYLAQLNADEARKWYTACFDVRERLAKADPNNLTFQNDLAFAYTNFGAIYRVEEKWDQALAEQKLALAIRKSLHEKDPLNADWRFNLALSHRLIGDVLLASGKLDEALKSYTAQLRIIAKLVAEDDTNLAWQRHLARSHDDIGAALTRKPDFAGALEAYRKATVIEQRLVAIDPGNLIANSYLYDAYGIMAHLHAQLGEPQKEIEAYENARTAALRLASSRDDGGQWRARVARMLERIGKAYHEQNAFEAAAKAFEDSLEIRKQLATDAPNDPKLSGNLALRYWHTGNFYKDNGRRERARAMYVLGKVIAEGLVEREPDRVRWQKILKGLNAALAQLDSQAAAR